MQADHVGHAQQLLQRADRLGVAVAELSGAVVVDHPHADGLGQGGELAADIAIADDAERLAADLEAALGRLVPGAGMRGGGAWRDAAHQHDDLADGEFGDAAGVGERRVEHRDSEGGCRTQVDLVGADAEAADRHQRAGAAEHALGKLGAAADAEDVGAAHGLDQRVVLERLLIQRDAGIARALEQRDGGGADALEQDDLGVGAGEAGCQWTGDRVHGDCSSTSLACSAFARQAE